jgi:DNA gyrase subunit B
MLFHQAPYQHIIKLQDSRQHGVDSGAELFLVEGDSAAQAVSNLRNKQLQAVLPMQGKPMNAYKSTLPKILENPLFKALIEAIGAGVGDDFDVGNCCYTRIILLMDPDADGIHCGALMLLFFHRFMQPLLAAGMVEIARPPVGEVMNNVTKTIDYAYTDAQYMALIKAQKTQSINTVKYRGLAGIDVNILEALCIQPQTRKTSIMGKKDAEMALEIFGGDSSLIF